MVLISANHVSMNFRKDKYEHDLKRIYGLNIHKASRNFKQDNTVKKMFTFKGNNIMELV